MALSRNYIIKRLFWGLVSLMITTIVVTSILLFVPVDPARLSFGQQMDDHTLTRKTKELGLDQPIPMQVYLFVSDLSFVNFMDNERLRQRKESLCYLPIFSTKKRTLLLKLPYLRTSYQTGKKVTTILREAWPLTLILSLSSITLASLVGIILGMLSAYFWGSTLDKLLLAFGVVGYSLPSYVSALILSIGLGYFLHDWTNLNLQGSLIQFDDHGHQVIHWANLVLPSIALGIRPVAIIMQITRSTMIDVMRKNYIVTARSKGLSDLSIWWKHGLYNAANPIVSTITSWFASLLAGAFFVETIFNYQGIGATTVEALLFFDIPVVLGCIVTVGVLLVFINILTDVLYAKLNPSISLE